VLLKSVGRFFSHEQISAVNPTGNGKLAVSFYRQINALCSGGDPLATLRNDRTNEEIHNVDPANFPEGPPSGWSWIDSGTPLGWDGFALVFCCGFAFFVGASASQPTSLDISGYVIPGIVFAAVAGFLFISGLKALRSNHHIRGLILSGLLAVGLTAGYVPVKNGHTVYEYFFGIPTPAARRVPPANIPKPLIHKHSRNR
jgi:hypothetical protein